MKDESNNSHDRWRRRTEELRHRFWINIRKENRNFKLTNEMIVSHNDLSSALQRFRLVFLMNFKAGETIESYYCGITNDLERRQVEHNTSNYAITVECDCSETAKELEKMLHDFGFDTGEQVGNGGDDSVFVYMYKKIPGETVE